MKCAWQEYLRLLPNWMRDTVNEAGKDKLQELRVRVGQRPQLIMAESRSHINGYATSEDLNYIINHASRYSPWLASTVEEGYITAAGGHRIGICGEAVIKNSAMAGIRQPTSLCIRVARDFEGISGKAAELNGSVLIIGPPGSGKTTLLRDLVRQRSLRESIAVLDERGELFPVVQGENQYLNSHGIDVLSGCGKKNGIHALLRTMSPDCIATDEITEEADCDALLRAGWSGVSIVATAHASSVRDLRTRVVYKPIVEYKLFSNILVLSRDKTWQLERI